MQEVSFDNWTILFAVVAIHGFVLSYFILSNRNGNTAANRLLGILMIVYSVTILYYVGYWTRVNQHLPRFVAVIFNTIYLLGPILFLYFKAFTKKSLTKLDLIHLAPFALIVLLELPLYFVSRDNSLMASYLAFYYGDIFATTRVLLQCALNVGYAILLYKKSAAWAQSTTQAGFMKKLALLFWGYAISLCGYYAMVITGTLKLEYDYMVCFAMSFFVYYVGYSGYTVPQLVGLQTNGNGNGTKYEKSGLTESAAKHLAEKLVAYMEREKPHISNDLKLQELAQGMAISTHHLSQVINEQLDQSYSDFINSYRVMEAQRLLRNSDALDMKIIHIAYEVGFNNKTSFNSTFKKHTGMSPSQYRQRYEFGMPSTSATERKVYS